MIGTTSGHRARRRVIAGVIAGMGVLVLLAGTAEAVRPAEPGLGPPARGTAPAARSDRSDRLVDAGTSRCPWLDAGLSVAARTQELIDAMTPYQEAELLHLFWGGSGANPYEGENPAIPSLCIPNITEQDGAAGVGSGWRTAVGQFRGVTQLPAPINDAAAFDPSLASTYGRVIGSQDAGVGVDVALAPTINIERDPLWGRAYESLGEDPYLTASLAVPLIKGIQSQRVVAVVKHFAVYNQETGRGTRRDDALLSDRALHEIYLPAWSAAVQQGRPGGVMCAYNLINGVPACQDLALLREELRGVWHFDGFVRSDCGSIFNQAGSIAAGVAQVKCTRLYQPAAIAHAVDTGSLPRATLDGLVASVLRVLFAYNLIAAPHPPRPNADVVTATDRAVSLRTANEGAVLLTNNGLLPLNPARLPSVALIGPDAGSPMTAGLGAMRVHPRQVVSALEALRSTLGDRVSYYAGSSPADAARVARAARVAIVVLHDRESEGRDRTTLSLPATQTALVEAVLAANPRTVVVLETGAPVLLPWASRAAAILETWYPGDQAGSSLVDLLTGRIDPGGKLPVSWPASQSARPDASVSEFGGGGGPTTFADGIDVGYRWYEVTGVAPQFSFGYGLSYTRFSFSRLRVVPRSGGLDVAATVTDTGRRTGTDVVQVYVGDPAATREPPRQLRGFQRVTLHPGQAARVTFRISRGDLSVWDAALQTWAVATGTYRVYVGDASDPANLPLRASVSVAAGIVGPDSGPAPSSPQVTVLGPAAVRPHRSD